MTKTLTEQWRDGTLPDGYYYITSKKWGMLIDRFKDQINDCGNEWRGFDNCQGIVDEVLAPVPDYMDCKRLRYDRIELDKAKIKIYELVSNSDELVQKTRILNEQNTKQYNELCGEIKKNNMLEKKLAIAIKALKKIIRDYEINDIGYLCVTRAKKALKEMEGVK